LLIKLKEALLCQEETEQVRGEQVLAREEKWEEADKEEAPVPQTIAFVLNAEKKLFIPQGFRALL